MTDLATNSQGSEAVTEDQDLDTSAADAGVDTADQANDDATDTDQTEGELDDQQTAEDDTEEVDYEGAKYKVPKPLKDALLRQADYTQKTQALAATRQELEQRQQAFTQQVQTHAALTKEIGEYHALGAQIAQYDPDAIAQLATEDAGQALQFSLQRQALVDKQAALANAIGQKQQAQALEQQRSLATQIEQSRQTLQKEIPGWNDAVYDGLQTFGQQTYGFQAAEIGQVIDPRMIKVLHDAQQWRSHQAKAKATQKVAQAQKTAPANTVRGPSGKFTPAADTSDFSAFERMADDKLRKTG